MRAVYLAMMLSLTHWSTSRGADFPISGLVAWWAANGNGSDEQNVANGGLFNGVSFAPGVSGQAFNFDGVDDRVSAPDFSMDWSSALSIEAWVKIRSYSGAQDFGWGMIFFRGDDRNGLDSVFLATRQEGAVYFHLESESGESANLVVPCPTNEWVHLAATYSQTRSQMAIYINGQLADSLNTAVIPLQQLDPGVPGGIGIGNHSGFPGTHYNMPFNGHVDNVRVYARDLSPRDVERLYCMDGGVPRLNIRDTGGALELEWAWTASPYEIESGSLSGPAPEWHRVVAAPELGADGFNRVVLPKGNEPELFRLTR